MLYVLKNMLKYVTCKIYNGLCRMFNISEKLRLTPTQSALRLRGDMDLKNRFFDRTNFWRILKFILTSGVLYNPDSVGTKI